MRATFVMTFRKTCRYIILPCIMFISTLAGWSECILLFLPPCLIPGWLKKPFDSDPTKTARAAMQAAAYPVSSKSQLAQPTSLSIV